MALKKSFFSLSFSNNAKNVSKRRKKEEEDNNPKREICRTFFAFAKQHRKKKSILYIVCTMRMKDKPLRYISLITRIWIPYSGESVFEMWNSHLQNATELNWTESWKKEKNFKY